MPLATGVVLAGGRATRFGSDKLAARLDGRTLLEHAMRGLGAVCAELVVTVAPHRLPPALPPSPGVATRLVVDVAPDLGPLGGLVAGLAAARHPLVLVAGGDMPTLEPLLLAALLERLASTGAGAVGLEEGGALRPLPCAIRREVADSVARRLLAPVGGARASLRVLLRDLDVLALPEPEWRAWDPEARSLRDVDTPDDLAKD